MKLVIVVPCYNEEEVLAETTRQLSSVVDELLSDGKIDEGKILYVDDGSRDRTWELIRGFSETHPSVTGLKLAHNVGHQQALWAGLEWAASHADAAVSIDADLQDDVRSIVGMVDAWRGGADIVYGVRRERTTDTFFKKNTAQAFYKLMNALGGDIVYNHADFRLMSRRTLQALMAYPERNLFLRGMVSALGYPSARVYYDRKERMAGESKYPFSKMLSFALDGITFFFRPPVALYFHARPVVHPHFFGSDSLWHRGVCRRQYHSGMDFPSGFRVVHRRNDPDGLGHHRGVCGQDIQRGKAAAALFRRTDCGDAGAA